MCARSHGVALGSIHSTMLVTTCSISQRTWVQPANAEDRGRCGHPKLGKVRMYMYAKCTRKHLLRWQGSQFNVETVLRQYVLIHQFWRGIRLPLDASDKEC